MYTLAPVCSILSGGSTTPHMAVMTEPSGFAVAHGWYLSGVYTGLSKIEVIWQCYQSANFVSVFVCVKYMVFNIIIRPGYAPAN